MSGAFLGKMSQAVHEAVLVSHLSVGIWALPREMLEWLGLYWASWLGLRFAAYKAGWVGLGKVPVLVLGWPGLAGCNLGRVGFWRG